jgi:murein L,D-transpeptidase YafK
VGRYAVAYGWGGMDKREQGDKKTPLGTYRLGNPRASKAFGTFIHVGYPTRAQRAKGMTGSAIGIHGPHRNLVWAGRLNTLLNATDGCVMVTEEDIQAIAAWVRLKRVRKVHIEPRLAGS